MPDCKRSFKVIAGWTAFVVAIVIVVWTTANSFDKNGVGDHTQSMGYVTALLAFASACFGLKSYDNAVTAKTEVAKLSVPQAQ